MFFLREWGGGGVPFFMECTEFLNVLSHTGKEDWLIACPLSLQLFKYMKASS